MMDVRWCACMRLSIFTLHLGVTPDHESQVGVTGKLQEAAFFPFSEEGFWILLRRNFPLRSRRLSGSSKEFRLTWCGGEGGRGSGEAKGHEWRSNQAGKGQRRGRNGSSDGFQGEQRVLLSCFSFFSCFGGFLSFSFLFFFQPIFGKKHIIATYAASLEVQI